MGASTSYAKVERPPSLHSLCQNDKVLCCRVHRNRAHWTRDFFSQFADARTYEKLMSATPNWGEYRILSSFDDDNNATTLTNRFDPALLVCMLLFFD